MPTRREVATPVKLKSLLRYVSAPDAPRDKESPTLSELFVGASERSACSLDHRVLSNLIEKLDLRQPITGRLPLAPSLVLWPLQGVNAFDDLIQGRTWLAGCRGLG